MNKSTKEHVMGVIDDLISDFLYYDRKEDEDLPRGVIEESIKNGEFTVDDLVQKFKTALEEGI